MAAVLLFNLPPEKQSFLQVMSVRLNFKCRIVDPSYQFSPISDLLSGTDHIPAHGKPFRDEMLVMDGFSHQDLNFLLNEMIRAGNTIPLKAVTTPTNMSWTPVMLHMQLVMENRNMSGRFPEANV